MDSKEMKSPILLNLLWAKTTWHPVELGFTSSNSYKMELSKKDILLY